MLTGAPKIRRRRRRGHHKRSLPAKNMNVNLDKDMDKDVDEDDENSNDAKNDYNDKEKTFSPRVNSKFINEDVEIETAILLKHLTKDTEFMLKKERAISFFTSTLTGLDGGETMQLANNNDEIKNNDEIEMMPKTTQESYQDDQQLALSYLNEEFEEKTVVVPFDKNTIISFDDQQIYLPKLTFPTELPCDDIEAGKQQFQRNMIDEGLFVTVKPKILSINRALFINRLIEEGALHWIDSNEKQIKYLFDMVLSERLIKTICAEKFHPIDYPPSSVCLEFDTFLLYDRILKIYIKHIEFDVHPTFNDEQKLVRQLESLYNEYLAYRQNDILSKIEMKLKILRQLLGTVSISCKSKTQKQCIVDSMQIHRDELKEMREMWHKESANYRNVMKTILEKWTELKKLRENISEPSTHVKLIIRTQESDVANDEREWSERFQLEHCEMMEEAMAFYRKHKSKRKKRVKKRNKHEIDPQNDEQEEEDMPPLEMISKPNASIIEEKLLKIFSNSMRPPGEKIMDLQLENMQTVAIKSLPKYIIRLVLDDGHLEFPESLHLNSIGQAQLHALYSIKFTTKISSQLKFQVLLYFHFLTINFQYTQTSKLIFIFFSSDF